VILTSKILNVDGCMTQKVKTLIVTRPIKKYNKSVVEIDFF